MLIEDFPLNTISGTAFGSDPRAMLSINRIDGSRFLSDCNTFEFPTRFSSSLLMVFTDPVKVLAFRSKTPFTTTCSSVCESSFRMTFNVGAVPTLISWVFIPTKEITRTVLGSEGMVMEKLPSISVTTPKVVPFT